jgi:hypothetical protein
MEHRHRAVELRLDRWITGNREAYFTEFSRVACGMLMLVLSNGWRNESHAARKSDCRDQQKRPHEQIYYAFAQTSDPFLTRHRSAYGVASEDQKKRACLSQIVATGHTRGKIVFLFSLPIA